MNENHFYLSYNSENDAPVDFKDILTDAMLHWRGILISMLLFCFLGACFSFLRTKETVSISSQIASAREALPENSAKRLEDLHTRMLAYQEYQQYLESDFASYVSNAANPGQYIILNKCYYLSTSIDDLEAIFPSVLLSDEDYKAMNKIIEGDDSLSTIYDRIIITSSENINSGSDSAIVNISPDENEYRASNYLFLVSLYGSSEEQCHELISVINAAMDRCLDSFKPLDPKISIIAVNESFSHNTRDFVQKQINKNMSVLNSIETQRTNLNNNLISKLNDQEKAYYELLVKSETDTPQEKVSGKPSSLKKYMFVALAFGLLFGIGLFLLTYIFDGKIKIAEEAEQIFQKKVLQSVYFQKNKSLAGRIVASINKKSSASSDKKTDLAVADLLLLMKRSGHTKLYLLYDETDSNAEQIALKMKERLSKKTSDVLHIDAGNPTSSISELERFTDAEEAVIVAELKKTKTNTLKGWNTLCERYSVPVIGIVTAESY